MITPRWLKLWVLLSSAYNDNKHNKISKPVTGALGKFSERDLDCKNPLYIMIEWLTTFDPQNLICISSVTNLLNSKKYNLRNSY